MKIQLNRHDVRWVGLSCLAFLLATGLTGWAETGTLISSWTKATALPVARFSHGCAVVGRHIYVVGGHSGSRSVNDVYYAEIVAPGKLGAWKTTAVLPVPALCSPVVVVVGRRLYVIGGDSGVKEVGVPVRYGDVADDGSIARWQEGPRLPEGTALLGCAVICSNAVYYMGGWYNRKVHRAVILPNGDLGPWKSLGNLPCNLMAMGSGVVGNTMVLAGGSRTIAGGEENCYWAKVAETGRLSWRMTEPLPEPNAGFGSAQKGNLFFVIGGAKLAVWATRILPDEGLAEWTPQQSLPHAASYLQAATAVYDKGYVYVIGGLVDTKEGHRSGWNEVWVGEVKE